MEDGECAIRYTYSEQGKSVSETAILNEVSIYGVRKWIVDMRIWRSRRRAVGSGQNILTGVPLPFRFRQFPGHQTLRTSIKSMTA